MNKTEVQQRVLQNGKPLDLNKFSWDETTKTFSTNESNLAINFTNIAHCTFITGFGCTFNTGSDCTFNTGSYCTFITGFNCTFNTSFNCTFNTSSYCTFITGYNCTFKTGYNCTFKTGVDCVCVRRDIFEFFLIPSEIKIQLNGYKVLGYTELQELKK